jgi:hypothetical protein
MPKISNIPRIGLILQRLLQLLLKHKRPHLPSLHRRNGTLHNAKHPTMPFQTPKTASPRAQPTPAQSADFPRVPALLFRSLFLLG